MKIVKGRLNKPRRIVCFGPEGIGKSTFASLSPNPIFIGAEDGTSQLDIHRFNEPDSWPRIIGALEQLLSQDHDYKTVVVDTLDWAEPMVWAHICERDGKRDISDYDWGRGYTAAVDQWRMFLHKLDALRKDKNMGVILLAHAHVKQFNNPEGKDYDRYELKLHHKSAGLIKEWADCVLFANYETYVHEQGGKVKGIDEGARVIYTERRAAWDAKNREGLPPKIAFSWDAFMESTRSCNPENRVAEAKALLEHMPERLVDDARKLIEKYKDRSDKLTVLINRMKGQIGNEQENS